MPARNLTILILATIVSMLCYRTASRNHYSGLLAAAIGEISDTFVRPIEDRELFEGAMKGMVQRLDPYSNYISPAELEEFE
jgi:C-terminal processing protease CtpA/Prc